MKREIRNPKSHRPTAGNRDRTLALIDTYQGKIDLLRTWETQPKETQATNHAYILALRKAVRTYRNYLVNRADPITTSAT